MPVLIHLVPSAYVSPRPKRNRVDVVFYAGRGLQKTEPLSLSLT
jgi:hypothetical protein